MPVVNDSLKFIGAFTPPPPGNNKPLQDLQTKSTIAIGDRLSGERIAQTGRDSARDTALINNSIDPAGNIAAMLGKKFASEQFSRDATSQRQGAAAGFGSALLSGTPGNQMFSPTAPLQRQVPTSTSAASAGKTVNTNQDTTEGSAFDPKTGRVEKKKKVTTNQVTNKAGVGLSPSDEVKARDLSAQAISILGLKAGEFEIVPYPGTKQLVIHNLVTGKYLVKKP